MRAKGLYDPRNDKDSCGVGLVANVNGLREHAIVEHGLRILERMEHRGAENADGKTGDGTGIMVQVPHEFIVAQGIPVPELGRYGTGILFLPTDERISGVCMGILNEECDRHSVHVICTRDVPVDHSVPGALAMDAEPRMVQVFITSYDGQDELERKLYSIRKRVSNRVAGIDVDGFYICSLSTRTMVYKGMLTPVQIRSYFKDLSDPRFKSAIAMVHSRFSTNTMPMWKLAQPFRMLCHNGEINTIGGNRAWMSAREGIMESERLSPKDIFPIVQEGMSDSASLDNVFEFLNMSGRSMANAISMMIPESWNGKNPIPDSLRAYYEYNSILMEPWDGPAAVLFTDGTLAGGMLDRNGLRPARYSLTKDGLFVLASELGVLDIDDSNLREVGRLMPGKMILIDTAKGEIIRDEEIKRSLAGENPYRDWLEFNRLDLIETSSGREVGRTVDDLQRRMVEFGYTKEDLDEIVLPMAMNSKEPAGAMGFDAPLSILSGMNHRLFTYFRQSFAQVTNPPIDPIREDLVMSINGYLGSINNNFLEPDPRHCGTIRVRHPVIDNRSMDLLRHLEYRNFTSKDISLSLDPQVGLRGSLERICKAAEDAVDEGTSYIILTDKGMECPAIPSLLAVSAVHQHLLRAKKRLQVGLVLESAEPREVMHFALLIGYGANVINPYLVFAIIEGSVEKDMLRMDVETAEGRYLKAVEDGIMKVMSKMGIATIRSYRGSMLFESIGLSKSMVNEYFGGTASNVGGIGLNEIQGDVLQAYMESLGPSSRQGLDDHGTYRYKKEGEAHAWSPRVVKLLQGSVKGGDLSMYREFADLADGDLLFIRSIMDVQCGKPIPLEEVEPAESIMSRFIVEGISFGAISIEAHETLAESMNLIGGQSNTGEGGEDPRRFKLTSDGRNLRSKVKQVASGRFGVTAEYLVDADEIQIKIAQGAKPGEGGQLMGFKVDEVIAATRHTIPGITLISPPPHHDIYSIEDLKQLIHDMKSINPLARVSVKLVSEFGVGTVAAGSAKAGADAILISGADGGTGASPLSSIRYAGMPWEVGLAETQQTLMANGLRGRVRLQVDGQMKTGRDVIISALLGAEEYGFSTAPMVAMGCVMCRKCHMNTCPKGIATQDRALRERFTGTTKDVCTYFRYIAEDVRNHLSRMGHRSLKDIIGHAELIRKRSRPGNRWDMLDLSPLTAVLEGEGGYEGRRQSIPLNPLDRRMIGDFRRELDNGSDVALGYGITNVDRSVGTMLSGEIVRMGGLSGRTLSISFSGTAGQSFGAFLTKGVHLSLDGQANDYVGKGLSGGRISIRRGCDVEGNVIAGNTLLYGATSGEAYIAGKVGERFCVRNSGALAVVEGVGDHCCEYMTGGCVVVLGETGRNFAAGMSAGVAYVLNEQGNFDKFCNMGMIELYPLDNSDLKCLKGILEGHLKFTGSKRAKVVLDDWDRFSRMFLKVLPTEYGRILRQKRNDG